MSAYAALLRSGVLSTDLVEHNVDNVAMDAEGAARELSQASEYQRKAGRRAACLMIILVVVTAIVLLAVSICLTVLSSGSHIVTDPQLDSSGCTVA